MLDSFVLFLFTAAKEQKKGIAMPQISVSAAQEAEIYATVRREQPKIDRATSRMQKQLKGLSGVSQKQAIASLVSGWVMGAYPQDKEMALLLSEHMREQVDVYIRTVMGDEQFH